MKSFHKSAIPKRTLILSVVIPFLIPGCIGWYTKEEILNWWNLKEYREKRALNIVNNCANWFITEGLAIYYRTNDFKQIQKYIRENDAILYINKIFGPEYGVIAGISISSWWVGLHIDCYERLEYDNKFYEYWALKYDSKRPDFDRHIRFLVVEGNNVIGQRKITHESSIFFPEFNLQDGKKLKFPLNNILAVYSLAPWYYPVSFIGTELEGVSENEIRKKVQKYWQSRD